MEKEIKEVTCPDCGGYGYVVDIISKCCGNANEYGSCCGIPEPEQFQRECYCDNGKIIIEI